MVKGDMFSLSDVKYIRSRSVYSLITLISEVSGVADILFVASIFLMHNLYVDPQMAYTLAHSASSFSKPTKPTRHKDQKIDLMLNIDRSRLKINLFHVLTYWLPLKCRRRRSKAIIELSGRARKKLDRALDIKSVLKVREDVQLLLRKLMTTRQRYLFNRHRDRLVSLNHNKCLLSDSP